MKKAVLIGLGIVLLVVGIVMFIVNVFFPDSKPKPKPKPDPDPAPEEEEEVVDVQHEEVNNGQDNQPAQ